VAPQTNPQVQPEAAPVSDAYLSQVSDESLEVLQHFGAETPALLNRYSCVLEDSLLNQARQTYETQQQLQQLNAALEEAKLVIGAAAEDNAAYHTLLTDPDLLSDYVIDFYGPQGPYPVETPRDRLAQEVAMAENGYAPRVQPIFQRPQLDMPAPGVQSGNGGSDFWNAFEQVSSTNPAALYQLLSQATPEDLRSRVLISERPVE
jgi:type II secretory pathway pseudopilin PulG